MDVVQLNSQRNLYLREIEDGQRTGNVIYIPKNWCNEFSISGGDSGGLDNPEKDGGPEIYCYAAILACPNSPVETMFVRVELLNQCEEITESEAQSIHPRLFEHLDEIDALDESTV
jgi:hypothetical protein